MRSIMKKIMRISLIILVAGIVLVVLGIILGGKPSFSIDLKKHKIYTNLDAVSEETVITGEFKNIDVKADTEDVEIILTEEESYKVEYRVMGREPKIKEENGTLTIREASQGFGVIDFGMHLNFPKTYIKIYVPVSAMLEEVTISTDTGDIQLNTLQASYIKLKSDTGNISANHIETSTLAMTTDTGNIAVDDGKVEEGSTDSDTGNIRMKDISIESLSIETDTGNIKMEKADIAQLEAKSDTGNVTCEVEGKEKEYGMKLKTDVGKIKVNGTSQGSRHEAEGNGRRNLNITTDTGNITVSFAAKLVQ